MFENVPDILEVLKSFPVSLSVLCVIPLVFLCGPTSCVQGAHEFPVFRMQHFDLHQTPIGMGIRAHTTITVSYVPVIFF